MSYRVAFQAQIPKEVVYLSNGFRVFHCGCDKGDGVKCCNPAGTAKDAQSWPTARQRQAGGECSYWCSYPPLYDCPLGLLYTLDYWWAETPRFSWQDGVLECQYSTSLPSSQIPKIESWMAQSNPNLKFPPSIQAFNKINLAKLKK